MSYFFKFLLIALVSVFAASTNIYAYDKTTKVEILDDVIKTCPDKLASFLSMNRQSIEEMLKDSSDVVDTKNYNIEDSFQALVAKLKNLRNDPYNAIVRISRSINGISDYINPGSYYKKRKRCKAVTVPYIFEYDGFDDISNTSKLLSNIEKKTGKNRCYNDLSSTGNDLVYSSTVNTISDYLINAWFKASNERGNIKSKFQIVRNELKPSTNKASVKSYNSNALNRAISNTKFYNIDQLPEDAKVTFQPKKKPQAPVGETYTYTRMASARRPEIKSACTQKWGTNYEMVKYCIDEQTDAYNELSRTSILSEIETSCRSKWSTNYEMVLYCVNEQTEAKRSLRGGGYAPEIARACNAKWGTNYEMVKYCIDEQTKAKRALQNY